MKKSRYTNKMIFCVFCAFFFVFFQQSVYAEDKKQILILDPYNKYTNTVKKLQDKDWAAEIISSISKELVKSKINMGINIQYMDTNNNFSDKYIYKLYKFYKYKFKDKKFDVVITIDDKAFDFAIKYANKLFPNTPIVFGGVCNLNQNILKHHPNFVGIKKGEDIKKTIDMALKLQPNTKQIFVVTDKTVNGSANKEKIKELVPFYKNKVKFIFSKHENIKNVKEKISNLSKDSFVLLQGWLKNDNGEYLSIKDIGNMLLKKINIPVYSTWNVYMGNGTVGGTVTDSYSYGSKMGEMAIRILREEKISNIKSIQYLSFKYMFDYKLLSKFNIKLDELPTNAEIINKPAKAYKIHKAICWSGIFIIVIIIVAIYGVIERNKYKFKVVKKSLFDKENLFSTIINATPDIIGCIDSEGMFLEANNELLNLLNIDKNAYKHKNLYQLKNNFGLSKAEWVNFKDNNDKAWRFRTVYRSEEKIQFKNQNVKKIYDVLRIPLFNDDGTHKLLVLLGRDITTHKINEKNKHLIEELKYYNKIRTDFFSNISHELRTPLNVIFSAIQVMELNYKDIDNNLKRRKFEKYTDIMKQNSFRLLRIINNLIDITKIDAGHFFINLKNYDIVNVVEDIVLFVADYVESKGISIVFDTELEEKIMAFDADAMERIILNLISNAIKFTPKEGKIKVNIYDKQDNIIIAVKDTGVGIPLDKQKAIFQRFIQVDKSLSRRREGSGIGLSLIKELIELHGGTISLKSEEGKGSEFRVKLPVRVLPKEKKNLEDRNYFNEDKVKRINIELSDIYN